MAMTLGRQGRFRSTIGSHLVAVQVINLRINDISCAFPMLSGCFKLASKPKWLKSSKMFEASPVEWIQSRTGTVKFFNPNKALVVVLHFCLCLSFFSRKCGILHHGSTMFNSFLVFVQLFSDGLTMVDIYVAMFSAKALMNCVVCMFLFSVALVGLGVHRMRCSWYRCVFVQGRPEGHVC